MNSLLIQVIRKHKVSEDPQREYADPVKTSSLKK
jgi:hypothetical protein